MKYLLAPVALLATVATLLSSVTPVDACSCRPPTLENRIRFADFIVIAEVVSLIDDKDVPHDRDAIVHVERYLKGLGQTQITVDDPRTGGGCGFLGSASIGRRYMLFLRSNSFRTSLCSGNVALSSGLADEPATNSYLAEVEAITGPGQPPDDTCEVTCHSPPSLDELAGRAFWALFVLISFLVLVIATLSPWRRR